MGNGAGDPTPTASHGRVHFLDSWRGIAAVAVVFFHLIAPISTAYSLSSSYSTWSRILFDGTDWVSFFFVLSGFALSYGFIVSGKTLDVLDFYVKRIFRIYPLYVIAVLCCYFITRRQGAYSGMELVRELLLFPRFIKLLIPGWSLSVEICCSLIMPLIIVYALHSRRSFPLLIVASLFFYSIIGHESEVAPAGFFFHFMLGTFIALLLEDSYLGRRKLKFTDTSLPVITLLLLSLYPLFCLRWYIWDIPVVSHIAKLGCDIIGMSFQQLFHFISGAISFGVILITLGNVRLHKILNVAPLQFLGKISFGIYVMHFPIINFLFPKIHSLLAGYTSIPVWLAIVSSQALILAVVIIVSYLTYIIIEKPFINLGQKVIALPAYISAKSRFQT